VSSGKSSKLKYNRGRTENTDEQNKNILPRQEIQDKDTSEGKDEHKDEDKDHDDGNKKGGRDNDPNNIQTRLCEIVKNHSGAHETFNKLDVNKYLSTEDPKPVSGNAEDGTPFHIYLTRTRVEGGMSDRHLQQFGSPLRGAVNGTGSDENLTGGWVYFKQYLPMFGNVAIPAGKITISRGERWIINKTTWFHPLEGYTIRTTVCDKQGQLWIVTLGMGIGGYHITSLGGRFRTPQRIGHWINAQKGPGIFKDLDQKTLDARREDPKKD
jgi:hypothetical protein